MALLKDLAFHPQAYHKVESVARDGKTGEYAINTAVYWSRDDRIAHNRPFMRQTFYISKPEFLKLVITGDAKGLIAFGYDCLKTMKQFEGAINV